MVHVPAAVDGDVFHRQRTGAQQTLQEIWNGPAYQSFREGLLSDHPPSACANCGLRWSL